VLIEPQPELAAQLRAHRTAKVIAVACSSPANAGKTLPLHVAGPLSSLDRARMAPGATPETVIMVPVKTLDSVLEQAGAPDGFDFLSVDVGGHEIEVLRGFDIARWRPQLILLEDHVGDLSKHRYLKSAGYRIIRRYENNGWYVPREAADRPGLSDRWEILRKYYLALPFRWLRNVSRRLRKGRA
jgi:FkbM family methyltransferase